MTVDEIIATGQYTDRRGRVWAKCPVHPTELNDCWWAYGKPVPRNFEHKPESTMRLLIERDQHRDECPRLSACNDHPVPSVIVPFTWGSRDFEVYAARENTTGTFEQSLPEAMDAARALAVGG